MPIPIVRMNASLAAKIEKLVGKKYGGVVANLGEDAMLVVLTGKDRHLLKRWWLSRPGDHNVTTAERDLAEKLFKGIE